MHSSLILRRKNMTEDAVYQRIDKFHAHLDICSQCRNHCFDLCPIGARLLREAATGRVDESKDNAEEPIHDR